MATFPIREAEIKALAQNIVTGLTDNAALYPAPPVAPAALQALLDSFIALCDEAVAAQAASEQVTNTKTAGRKEVTDGMKADLRYAEDTVAYDDAQLSLLGWAGMAAPSALDPPGQARTLEAPNQGEGRKRGLYQATESPSETGLSPRLGDVAGRMLQKQIVETLSESASLPQLKRNEEAIAGCDELVTHFGEAAEGSQSKTEVEGT